MSGFGIGIFSLVEKLKCESAEKGQKFYIAGQALCHKDLYRDAGCTKGCWLFESQDLRATPTLHHSPYF
jgi:hypothetical protein